MTAALVWTALAEYYRWGGINISYILLSIYSQLWMLEVQSQGDTQSGSGECPLTGLHRAIFSSILTWQKERKDLLYLLFYKDTSLILGTPSVWSNYFPKTSPAGTIPPEFRDSTYVFFGRYNPQSITIIVHAIYSQQDLLECSR